MYRDGKNMLFFKKGIFWTKYAFFLWEYATYLSKYAFIFENTKICHYF